jgi:hypothetical protein
VKRVLLAGVSVSVLAMGLAAPARADLLDWEVSPFTADVGDAVLTVGGSFDGAAYVNNQPDFPGKDASGVTGSAGAYANLMRTYDTGLVLGLKTSYELFHDKLSGDNYGSDFFQKIYGVVQTGLGRVEIGMTDGAGYTLAVPGPVVDGVTALDNPNATFFVDPVTGGAFINQFVINSAVEPTFNYAKIAYYTPRLFGVQLGVSFTPSEGKDVIPFISAGPDVANKQRNIWEIAASYQGSSGKLSYNVTGAVALGHAKNKDVDHHGLTDWAIGTQFDYTLNDDMTLSWGGEYRRSNQYVWDINDAVAHGTTQALHLGTTLSFGDWIVGGEFATGSADNSAVLALPAMGIHGYEASVGYTLNTNMALTLGWQQWNYATAPGVFYDGLPHIKMDAGYLHLNFHI